MDDNGQFRVEGGGKLLFKLDQHGVVEILRDGWLYYVNVPRTVEYGYPVVERRFVGKMRKESQPQMY